MSTEAKQSTHQNAPSTHLEISLEGTYAEARRRVLEAFDRAYIEGLLHHTDGNVSEAARRAGLDRSNFKRVLKRVRKQVDALDDEEPTR